ncbi:hypothetical protein BCR44DRAFT_1425197 [Catenaria anguillulae PL171]|uniref:Uncharacterized protein n=1 Tax=Catenaria anguillulae PL171 TaxID=765915 RepID=A0A1Y2I2Q5_9FUNG|nr:hypothetical protein BCR44DRAFT_1425197 [Catenaria anguillulae PL171]
MPHNVRECSPIALLTNDRPEVLDQCLGHLARLSCHQRAITHLKRDKGDHRHGAGKQPVSQGFHGGPRDCFAVLAKLGHRKRHGIARWVQARAVGWVVHARPGVDVWRVSRNEVVVRRLCVDIGRAKARDKSARIDDNRGWRAGWPVRRGKSSWGSVSVSSVGGGG